MQRLPPAHRLIVGSAGAALERYWTFPIEEPVYYKHDAEYGAQLRSVVGAAVKDRLRTPKVAVFMSGGLDSSTLAAIASRCFQNPADHVAAHTIVVEGPEPDDEPYLVDQIARRLGIRAQYRRTNAAFYDGEWQTRRISSARNQTASSSATTRKCSTSAPYPGRPGSPTGARDPTTR